MRETKRLKEQNWTVAGGEDDERKMAVRWLGHPDTRHQDSLRCFQAPQTQCPKPNQPGPSSISLLLQTREIICIFDKVMR